MKIAVLGAGLMGRIMAMRLYQEGFTDITILEKDAIGASNSPAVIAAGMLSSLSESVAGGGLIHTLGENSIALWTKYLAQLDASHLLSTKGTLLISPMQSFDEVAHYIAKISFNTSLARFYQLLNQTELNALEPELNFKQAYFLAAEGALNAPKVMSALANYLTNKVVWQSNSEASEVSIDGTVQVGDKSTSFELVFDCRGMGARAIYPELRAVRGEIIRVHAPDVNLSRPIRLFHPRHKIYIVPTGDNHYIIGATEVESADYSAVSVKSTLDLLGCACSVHSGFAEARITNLDSNCRPTLSNNCPQIKLQGNLIAINGLYRHGFLLSPALAEEVIAYLANGKQQLPQLWS